MSFIIPSKGKLLYEENTREHIDDIWFSRGKQKRKEGKKFTIIVSIIILPIVAIFLFSLGILGLTRTGAIWERIIFLIGGFFLILLMIPHIKLILITDNLKIYSKGISLPTRTFSEWHNKKEHFISLNDIKEIYIERRYIERGRGQLMPIEIKKKDGTIEKINPYYFGNLNNIKDLLKDEVKIIKREYTTEELMRKRLMKTEKKLKE